MTNLNALSTKQAAVYLGISESTLRQGRMNGHRDHRINTPPFIRVNRKILYLHQDLERWLQTHRVSVVASAEGDTLAGSKS